jgi:hypothetical protein
MPIFNRNRSYYEKPAGENTATKKIATTIADPSTDLPTKRFYQYL